MAKEQLPVQSEPRAIADRICLPAPLWSCREGMKFFLANQAERAIKRQEYENLHGTNYVTE